MFSAQDFEKLIAATRDDLRKSVIMSHHIIYVNCADHGHHSDNQEVHHMSLASYNLIGLVVSVAVQVNGRRIVGVDSLICIFYNIFEII